MDRIRIKNHRGFAMELWRVYTINGRTIRTGKDTYNYKVLTPTGVLFAGKGYQPSVLWKEKIAILDGLVEWLCLCPGDTDREYFEKYTPEQLEWANSNECENVIAELSS